MSCKHTCQELNGCSWKSAGQSYRVWNWSHGAFQHMFQHLTTCYLQNNSPHFIPIIKRVVKQRCINHSFFQILSSKPWNIWACGVWLEVFRVVSSLGLIVGTYSCASFYFCNAPISLLTMLSPFWKRLSYRAAFPVCGNEGFQVKLVNVIDELPCYFPELRRNITHWERSRQQAGRSAVV